MTESKTKNQRISEGIVLALSSAGAYLFAFYYEKGFASVFKIPESLINVTLTSILTFGVLLISVIFFALPTMNMFFSITTSIAHPVLRRTLSPIILAMVLLFAEMYIFGIENWRYWIPFIILVIVLIFLQLVFPLITQRRGKYIDKLEAQEQVERQVTDTPVIIRNRFGNDSLIIILIFLFGWMMAQTTGVAEALKQKEFLVTNTTPEMVVLRIYGDNMICVPFDRHTHEIKQEFTVLKITAESGLVLKLEDIGQLHLPKVSPVVQITSTAFPTNTLVPAPTNNAP